MYLLWIIFKGVHKENIMLKEEKEKQKNKLETINNLTFSLLKIHHVYAIMRFNYT